MVFRFGDIEFQPMRSDPTSITIERGVNLAEQERLSGGPTLQDVGGVLTRIEMDLFLHASLGNVRDRYDAFLVAMRNKEPHAFINGAGFTEGDFVITSIRAKYNQLDAQGRLIQVDLAVSFKEYIEAELEDREELAARKAAVATISANPITVAPTVKYQTPKSAVMREITTSVSSVGTAAAAGKTAASIPDVVKREANKAKQALVTARDSLAKARTGVDQIQSQISNAIALKSVLTSTLDTVNQMYDEIETGDPTPGVLGGLSQSLESGIDGIMAQSAQLATLTALRK